MRLSATEKAPWDVHGAEKRDAVRKLFGDLASSYDRFNSVASLSLHHRWRDAAVSKLGLKQGDTALDLCCGTGDFMKPLRRVVGPKGIVLGLDFCEPMIRIATQKGLGDLAMGDACILPVGSARVHAVTVGWGIRNVSDVDAAHREIVRVLKPGGRYASLDMAKPRNRVIRACATFFLGKALPLVGALFGKRQAYAYLPQSTARFLSREELSASMEKAGLTRVAWRDFMFGNVCLHWGEKP
jgi:demethylmenaquinone methyltransferase/2-methoxy-6-polyprenyl-1,4-benzoquinol methylase